MITAPTTPAHVCRTTTDVHLTIVETFPVHYWRVDDLGTVLAGYIVSGRLHEIAGREYSDDADEIIHTTIVDGEDPGDGEHEVRRYEWAWRAHCRRNGIEYVPLTDKQAWAELGQFGVDCGYAE